MTAAGRTHPMSAPFFVLATQNPIELEGTYPLPEAQLDRFMFKIELDYLSEADEISVVTTTTQTYDNPLAHPLGGQDILDFQRIARQVPAAEAVIPLRRAPRACLPAAIRDRAAIHPRLGQLGRRHPRLAKPDLGGQGAGPAFRPFPTSPTATCARWRIRFCGTGFCSTSMPKPNA